MAAAAAAQRTTTLPHPLLALSPRHLPHPPTPPLQGTYVYFDYNVVHDDAQAGWCYRLKQDFTFQYDALEDELQP